MIVRYDVAVADLIVSNRYYCAHSSSFKKNKLLCLSSMAGALIIGSLIIPPPEGFTVPMFVALTSVCAGLGCIVLNYYAIPASSDWQVRRAFTEEANKGIVGQHEIEIDDNGLVERTDINESRHFWRGIERIAETDTHAFIYISSVNGHVIPKRSVSFGDVDSFIARAKQLWLAANPDAAAKSEA